MIATKGTGFDVVLVSGEPYADHPLSPVGMIARVLDAEGYTVGVIECPDWKGKEDFLKLGRPRLFFGITSGSIDSMLVNYTPLKRERAVDPNAPFQSRMPDRAVIVYANRIRELHKGVRIVLGGIEASLRRFTHYDYWGDDVRRSILLDTRADILVYGPGEIQVVEIAKRLDRGEGLDGIRGTCVMRAEAPEGALVIPSFEEVKADK
ncbi:MAG: YgiQ family radical SAM protein, partial [Candidatus Aminicenantes bacterium]